MDALDLGDGFDLVAAALADVGAEELAPQQADVLDFDLAASVLEMPPEDEIEMKTSGFAQRSKAIMAYARKCKENRAAASTIRSLKDKLAEVNRRLVERCLRVSCRSVLEQLEDSRRHLRDCTVGISVHVGRRQHTRRNID